MALDHPGQLDVGAYARAAEGQLVGGDRALVLPGAGFYLLAVIDVLGHGPEAHQLASRIENFLRGHLSEKPLKLINILHQHLHGSRGAVVSLARFEPASGDLRFVGIGNAVGRILGPRHQHLLTKEGVLGHTLRSPREEHLCLTEGDLLLIYSDGVSSHFETSDYRHIHGDPAEIVAREVVRRFGKPHDDASCIAMRPLS
ncbi:MAG: SpoIIE family protein phosphatase [Pirellulaceae bacterium]